MNWNFTQSPWNNPTPEADQASNEAANTEPPLSPEYVRLLGKLRAGDRYSLILLPFDNIPQATVDEALRRGDAVKAGEYYLRASTQLLTRLGTEEAQARAASEASIIPDIKMETPDWRAKMWQEQMSAASLHQPEADQPTKEPVETVPQCAESYARLLAKLRTGESYWFSAQYLDGISDATVDEAIQRGDAVRETQFFIRASPQLLAQLQAEEAQAQAMAENLSTPSNTEVQRWGCPEDAQSSMPAETLNKPDSNEVAESDLIPVVNGEPLQPSTRVFAAQWLRDLLQKEPRWVEDLFRWAQEDGISIATLKRAKKSINAKSAKIGGHFGGEDNRWFWRLG